MDPSVGGGFHQLSSLAAPKSVPWQRPWVVSLLHECSLSGIFKVYHHESYNQRKEGNSSGLGWRVEDVWGTC